MTDPIGDLSAAIGDGRVWLALAIACAAGVLLLLLGVVIARRVGLLDADGDIAETFSVGLSVGLVAFAAAWASVASGGGSVFVPIAAMLLLAIAVGQGRPVFRLRLDRRSAQGGAAAAAFLVAIGLLYATTIAPSPRDGYQPVEFFDVGYYSVLGADLADTGRETIYSPSGFDEIAGLPEQTWYHWGELWLAAAAIDLTGVSPLHARHLIVLPLLLLAAVTMVGTLVRRLVNRTTEFYVIAAAATLFLAPIPVLRDVELEWFARSLVISITQYGLAASVILLGIYVITVRRAVALTWSGALAGGALTGALVATHIGLAGTIGAAIGVAILAWMGRSVAWRLTGIGRSETDLRPMVRGASMIALAGIVTVAWGVATGHGLGGLAPIDGVVPFDRAWQRSILETTVGAGVVMSAPIGWLWIRREHPSLQGLVLVTILAVTVGAVGWGVLVADLNTFHLLFGTIITVLTPVSIIVLLAILDLARTRAMTAVATIVLMLALGQSLLAAMIAGAQLQAFGPLDYPPTPVPALTALRALPPGAKAAYSCDAIENFAPWDASLVSLDAHTGVRMVPMCFMADRPRRILGRELDAGIESPYFEVAPQRRLYPSAAARPPTAAVESFLRANGIAFIYADAAHPNTLVPDVVPVFTADGITVYRIP